LFAASGDYLRDYAIKNGQLTAIASSSLKFENPGATPAISANGKKNAIPGLSQPSYGMAPIIAQPSSMHSTPPSSANRFIRPNRTVRGIAPRWPPASSSRWSRTVACMSALRSEAEVYGRLK